MGDVTWVTLDRYRMPRSSKGVVPSSAAVERFLFELLTSVGAGFLVPTGAVANFLVRVPGGTPAWMAGGWYGKLPDGRPFVVTNPEHATSQVVALAKKRAMHLPPPPLAGIYVAPAFPVVPPESLSVSTRMFLWSVQVAEPPGQGRQIYTFSGFTDTGEIRSVTVPGSATCAVWTKTDRSGGVVVEPAGLVGSAGARAYVSRVPVATAKYVPDRLNWHAPPVMQYMYERAMGYGSWVWLSEPGCLQPVPPAPGTDLSPPDVPRIPVAAQYGQSTLDPPHTLAFIWVDPLGTRNLHICTLGLQANVPIPLDASWQVSQSRCLDGDLWRHAAVLLRECHGVTGGVFVGDTPRYEPAIRTLLGGRFFYMSTDLAEIWRCVDVAAPSPDDKDHVVARCLAVFHAHQATYEYLVRLGTLTAFIPLPELQTAAAMQLTQSALQASHRAKGTRVPLVFIPSASQVPLTNSEPFGKPGVALATVQLDFAQYFPRILLAHKNKLVVNPVVLPYLEELLAERERTGRLEFKLLVNQFTGLLAHFCPEDYNTMTSLGRDYLRAVTEYVCTYLRRPEEGRPEGYEPSVLASNTDGFMLSVTEGTPLEAIQAATTYASATLPLPMRFEVRSAIFPWCLVCTTNQSVAVSATGDLETHGTPREQRNASAFEREFFERVARVVAAAFDPTDCAAAVRSVVNETVTKLVTRGYERAALVVGVKFNPMDTGSATGRLASQLVAQGGPLPDTEPLRYVAVVDKFALAAELPHQSTNPIHVPVYLDRLQSILHMFARVPIQFTTVYDVLDGVGDLSGLYLRTPPAIHMLYPGRTASHLCLFCGTANAGGVGVCTCIRARKGKREGRN